ncbi:MAG: hypothetical protein JNL02_16940 [Saprospiraceae bacterium]|nr:hypothetical protein [Saprospiraceae bacterium]
MRILSALCLTAYISAMFIGPLSAQKVERRLFYTLPPKGEQPSFLEFGQMVAFDAYPVNCFYLEEPGGYRVFLNGREKGLYPKHKNYIYPAVDAAGNWMMYVKKDGKDWVEFNDKLYGPFERLNAADLRNGHVVIKYKDTQSGINFVDIDSVNVWRSSPEQPGTVFVRVDEAGNIIREIGDEFILGSSTIYFNDSLMCNGCGIGYNRAAGKHSFVLYQHRKDKAHWYFLHDGRKNDRIDGYWVPQIDAYDNFILPHEKDGKEYVMVNEQRFGPIKSMRTVHSSTGPYGVVMEYHAMDDSGRKRHLYLNGKVSGPYDSLEVFPGADTYYYEAAGKRFLAKDEQVLVELPQGVTVYSVQGAGNHTVIVLSDGSVYHDGVFHRKYAEVENAGVFESGRYYIVFRDERDRVVVELDGRQIVCGAMPPHSFARYGGGIVFSADQGHFLKYAAGTPFCYIDGKRFECPGDRVRFYYLRAENTFAWLSVEGNQYYWNAVKLD